jgi:regulator of sirC expression with transglutaminase-like and TPR domain
MPRPFADIAAGPCAAADDLLLALAAEFWPVDADAARARLDDDARRLFGAAAFSAADQAHLLGTLLERELGIVPDTGADPELLRLDRLAHRRRGHPLLIAALGVELLRRAGVEAAVCSSPTRWFVGIAGGDRTVLLDARLSASEDQSPEHLRRHCAHELAFCALTGLAERFARAGDRSPARLALALRLALPVDGAVRSALQRDLDAFGSA